MNQRTKNLKIFRLLALLTITLRIYVPLAAQEPQRPWMDASLSPEVRGDLLLKQMTLEEKVGQLIHYYVAGRTKSPDGQEWAEVAARGGVGSLYGVTDPAQIYALQKATVERSRLHIPLLFAMDLSHGFRVTFPVPLGMAATWDPPLVERASRLAAKEASAVGVRWAFSPMVDIARDVRWGRIVEGAGEDPYLGSLMARTYVRGFQGQRTDASDSLAACPKHYVGYGAVEGGREYNSVDISQRILRQVYLPPFKAALEAGALSVMSAFDALNEVPASANPFTLRQVLRDEWKFNGVVVSDYDAVDELISQGIANDSRTAARKAIIAGVDIDNQDGSYLNLIQLIRSGDVPERVVDDAVRRFLRLKFALGLFDNPYVKSRPRAEAIEPESLETARRVAEESFVLLKNGESDRPVLPISDNVKSITLLGPLADSARDMLGPWSGAATRPRDVVTLRAALDDRARRNGIKLVFAPGTQVWGTSDAGFAEAVSAARQADLVLMALGEDRASSGEAGSRAHLGLPGNQEQLLQAVSATGKPVVVILFSGRPLTLVKALPHMAALLQAWFPGVQAGPALTRVLFGDVNPSGKLTATFPRAVGQEPLYYNALNTGRPPTGIDLSHPPGNGQERLVSRYLDEPNAPLFPFGYGLSYTRFSFSAPRLSASRLSAKALNSGTGERLRVAADVRNTGDRAGDEVVQLYIHEQGTSVARPVRELKGFQRITLMPGQSKQAEFTLGRDELRFWNIDMRDLIEPCRVTVWVGPNSREGESAEFEVTD